MEISTATPFVNTASRAYAAAPAFAVLFGIALAPLRARSMLTAGSLALAWAIGVIDVHRGVEYLNPIYLTPSREAAAQVAERANPADLVIADWDSVFLRYYPNAGHAGTAVLATDSTALAGWASQNSCGAIWNVRLGRDRTAAVERSGLPPEISGGWEKAEEIVLGEQDRMYRTIKEWLLRRPAYAFRITVERWIPDDRSVQSRPCGDPPGR